MRQVQLRCQEHELTSTRGRMGGASPPHGQRDLPEVTKPSLWLPTLS